MLLTPTTGTPGEVPTTFTIVERGTMAEDTALPSAFGRTLRIALAMRGGISLAVWIGGAVAELDLLRRIRLVRDAEGSVTALIVSPGDETPGTRERVEHYARMLGYARYDRVEFDVLAGASAGGLNAVIYSVAQRMGTPVDALLTSWTGLGGAEVLMHPPGLARVTSLFRGDDFFAPGVAVALRAFADADNGHEDLVAPQIAVELSATIIDGNGSREPDIAEGRGHFRFSADNFVRTLAETDLAVTGDTLLNGIPSRSYVDGMPLKPGAEIDDALSRLAYAARSTSSFPGAFEPASIHALPWYVDDPAARPDMRHVFGAHRGPTYTSGDADAPPILQPFRIVDGGVFDNIPIDRALAALRTRASAEHSERVVLYLDPSPQAGRVDQSTWRGTLSGMVAAIRAALARQRRRESEGGEVAELRQFSRSVVRSHGRLETMAPLVPRSSKAADVAERQRAYVRFRASADLELILEALNEPEHWMLGTDLRRRERFEPLAETYLARLAAELRERLEGDVSVPDEQSVLAGPQSVLDAAQCVFALVRTIDDLSTRFPSAITWESGPARAELYRIMKLATFEREKLLYSMLVAMSASGMTNDRGVPDPEASIAALINLWLGAPSTIAQNLMTNLTTLFVVVNRVRVGLDPDLDATSEFLDAWRRSPWSQLARRIAVDDLAPIFSATGIPSVVAQIGYDRITADEPVRPASRFPELVKAERRHRVRRALKGDDVIPGARRELLSLVGFGLSAATKLAGSGVGNFGGFLNAKWREGDWWWGHLDASQGVGRFISSSISELDPDVTQEISRLTAALQESIVSTEGAAMFQRATRRLDTLPASDRIALASRGIRVLFRAAVQATQILRILLEVALVPINWLRSLLPLAADPPRAAGAGLIALLAVAAASGDGSSSLDWGRGVWNPVLIIGVLAVIAVSVRLGGRAARRWRTLRSLVEGDGEGDGDRPEPLIVDVKDVHRLRAHATLRAATFGLVAVALVVLAVASFARVHTLLACLCTAGAVAMAFVGGTLADSVGEPIPPRTRILWIVVGIGFVVVAAAILFAPVLYPSVWVSPFAAVGVACGLVALLLTVGWLPWFGIVALAVLPAGALAVLGHVAAQVMPAMSGVLIALVIALWGTVVWWLPLAVGRDPGKQKLENAAVDTP